LPTRPQRFLLVLAVITLAMALSLALSGGAWARATFQSSPLLPTDTPDPALPIAPDPFLTPSPTAPVFQPEPLPVVTIEVAPAPTPTASGPGFLPAPTLTNPNDFLPGSGQLPPVNPPLMGAAAPPAEVEPTPAPEPPGVAELIDSAVMVFGYAWICCGGVVLGGVALIFVGLVRRSAQRRAPRIEPRSARRDAPQ
jgi:hypothetical protein